MVVVRVSENFADQLIHAQDILSRFLKRKITIAEITEKMSLKIVVTNKTYQIKDLDTPSWDIPPVIMLVQGIKRYRSRKAHIEIVDTLNPYREPQRAVITSDASNKILNKA